MNNKQTPSNRMTGVAMRGGFDVDEETLDDDANYWKMGAHGAEDSVRTLVNCCGEHTCRVDWLLGKYWGKDKTWKEICINTERVRDLIKLIVKEKK